jgi:hypothetical protein
MIKKTGRKLKNKAVYIDLFVFMSPYKMQMTSFAARRLCRYRDGSRKLPLAYIQIYFGLGPGLDHGSTNQSES